MVVSTKKLAAEGTVVLGAVGADEALYELACMMGIDLT